MLRKGATLIAVVWLKADVFHATGATVAKVGSKNSARFVLACFASASPEALVPFGTVPAVAGQATPCHQALVDRQAVPPSGSRYRVIYRACSHRLGSAFQLSSLTALCSRKAVASLRDPSFGGLLRASSRRLGSQASSCIPALDVRKARPSGPPSVATTRPAQSLVSAPWFSFSLLAFLLPFRPPTPPHSSSFSFQLSAFSLALPPSAFRLPPSAFRHKLSRYVSSCIKAFNLLCIYI